MERMNIITFEPLLKQTIWGGDKIKALKQIDTALDHVGESWEVSGMKDSESVVANGEYKGRSLNGLVAEMKGDFVGHDNYERFGDEFPLLVKFIDAQRDLSIQVHPDDELAHKYGKRHGKTEMWYLMDSDSDATLRCGLSRNITPEEYKRMIKDDSICDVINKHKVKEGDCFYIPAGCVHSIGTGCLLAEIQEPSDVTYRIYDFKRKDKDGNYRQLHTEQAVESIDYNVFDSYRIKYAARTDEPVQLVGCKYFNTAVYDLTEPMTIDYADLDSFVILVCMKGRGSVTDAKGNKVEFKAGTTILLPAWVDTITVEGEVKFLETYI